MQFGMPKPKLKPKTKHSVMTPQASPVLTTIGARDAIVPSNIQIAKNRVLPPNLFVRETPTRADSINAAKCVLHTSIFGRKSSFSADTLCCRISIAYAYHTRALVNKKIFTNVDLVIIPRIFPEGSPIGITYVTVRPF